ncbi:response regulator [Paramicrobacterium agarici]|uniref:Transcriptional regulatory protein n=1 Tax=Paramicrobacterium agarici TaxID=630514 RepID=A0A2A9DRF8_9MICO|nr:response regulator [Microbacterium agarici]PFG29367.1 response regulator of citrate/malate metabolism [Microbacterium agarici]TQO22375.1 response regulator of citrate/malate metabolism [Microbacterium agarici]
MTSFAVLVVDDDFAVARIHERFIEALDGFSVVGTAHSGSQALAKARSLQPDLVVLDLYLPDIGGLDVLAELRSDDATRDIDVIAVTAARDLDSVRRAKLGGAFRYIVKPFSASKLRDALAEFARTRRQLDTEAGVVVDQSAIDAIMHGGRVAVANAPLPKGIGEATLRRVVAALHAADAAASATDIAEATGLSRVSARRYLEHLTSTGQASVAPRYGQAGRPELLYSLTG